MTAREQEIDAGGAGLTAVTDGTPEAGVGSGVAGPDVAARNGNGKGGDGNDGRPTGGGLLTGLGGAFGRLYRGETHFDFVGRRRVWYTASLLVIIAGLVSIGVRGLNFGIDFRGGTSWTVAAPGKTVPEVQSAVRAAGLHGATVEILGGKTVQVEADLLALPQSRQSAIKTAVTDSLARLAHVSAVNGVSRTDVGPTWGGQVSQKAIIALMAFLIAVVVYISFRFEWKMAIAALAAVIHDLLVVIGVYSLSGFQVTPDTVIAVLTILGYSLYDTVVVFDRVGENTKGLGAQGRMTYEGVVNLSMNQVLARSINTSLVAILPVLSVLVIGAQILGATTLQYFGLALVIGLTSGAYSSIFIASPLLSGMKEREKRYQTLRARLEARAERIALLTPKEAALLRASGVGGGDPRASRPGGRPQRVGPGGRGGAPLRPGAPMRPGATRKGTALPVVGASGDESAAGSLKDARIAELEAELARLSSAGEGGTGGGGDERSGREAADAVKSGVVDGSSGDTGVGLGGRSGSGAGAGTAGGSRSGSQARPGGNRRKGGKRR